MTWPIIKILKDMWADDSSYDHWAISFLVVHLVLSDGVTGVHEPSRWSGEAFHLSISLR